MDRRVFLSETLISGVALLLGNIKLRAEQPRAEQPNVVKLEDRHWLVTVLRADCPNGNKRIYPKAVLEKAIKDFKTGRAPIIGQIGMPKDDIIVWFSPSNYPSHLTHDLRFEKDYLVADIMLLDTPQGTVLNKLLSSRPDLVAFRTSGVGEIKAREDGCFVVADNFRLTGIHALPINEAVAL